MGNPNFAIDKTHRIRWAGQIYLSKPAHITGYVRIYTTRLQYIDTVPEREVEYLND